MNIITTPALDALILEVNTLKAGTGSGDAYEALRVENQNLQAQIVRLNGLMNSIENEFDQVRDALGPRLSIGETVARAQWLVANQKPAVK